MDGVDTVIHMAANPSVQAPWEDILNDNIISTRNVLEAAKDAGVRRVIFASSNHTMGMYDRDGEWPVYVTSRSGPDSHYGASKVIGEVFGRYYYDAFGLEFISLRIGWFTEREHIDSQKDHAILRAMWLGPKDMVNVTLGAIEADGAVRHLLRDFGESGPQVGHHQYDHRPRVPPGRALGRVPRRSSTQHEPGDPPLRADWP